MRLKQDRIVNMLKGHMSASIIDSLMVQENPFDQDEKLVSTGSVIPYYLWHKGLSEEYIYKPPSDLDFVLSSPIEKERTVANITKYRQQMYDIIEGAVEHSGFTVHASNGNRYDNTLSIVGTYTPDQVQEALFESRLKDVLSEYGIEHLNIKDDITVKTNIDTMVLDNTVLEPNIFASHPNAQDSCLRHQALSTSIAFKIARCTLRRGFEQINTRPGDVIDAHNILNAYGYEHDPDLIHVMCVVALALQVPEQFDASHYVGRLLHRDPEELHTALEQHYRTRFSKSSTLKAIASWEQLVNDVFPNHRYDAPMLDDNEERFIMNFLMPYSGAPKESIVPELLQSQDALKCAFNKNNELGPRIKNSSFFQQRVSYHQISPLEIEV